jgi:membrane protein DedA with SNARE-associated domain
MMRRWEYWISILTIVITCLLALLIVLEWRTVQQMAGYGYFGGVVVSALGGASVLVPVPMLAVQFALGGVLQPWFGPALAGPAFVGLVCAFGESIGALTIYATGYSGGTPLANSSVNSRPGRIQRWYQRLMQLMEKRGSLVLFVLSAVMNPFFYPTSLACGAVRFGIKRYFLICFAGKAIKCTGIAYAGYFGLSGLFKALGITL